MKESRLQQAGRAFIWRGLQLGGTKIIFLLRVVILARILTPDDFGLVTIAASSIGFMMNITNFGMVEALVQEQDVDDKHYHAAWTVNVSRALLVSLLVILAAPLVAAIFSEPRSLNVIRLLALQPFLEALASIKVAGLTRELQFRPLALLKIAAATTNLLISILLAVNYGVWGLVMGALAGSTINLALSYIVAPYRPRLLFEKTSTRPLLQFGRWIYITSVVFVIGENILRITISRQLGSSDLGQYYLATQIAFLPFVFAGDVVGAVAFPLYSRLQTNLKMAAKTFRSAFTGTAALLYPLCALLIVLAPTLVEEILGAKWEGTAPIMRILTLVTIIGLFSYSTVPIFQGLGQPYRVTIVETVQSVILIVFVWPLAGRFGLVGATAAWIPAIVVAQILSAIFMRRLLSQPFAGLGRPLTAIILASSAGAAASWVLNHFLTGLIGFIAASVVGIGLTFLLLWASEKRFKLGFARDLLIFFPQLAQRIGIVPVEAGSQSL